MPKPATKYGRNELCYCDSGRKYKKCCLKKDLKEYGRSIKYEEIENSWGKEDWDKEGIDEEILALYQEENFNDAIELLEEDHHDYPHNTDIMMLLAECYITLHRFVEAVRVLLRAKKIKPSDPEIVYNLGYVLTCMGRASDGIGYIKTAYELKPPRELKRAIKKLLNKEEELLKKCEDRSHKISLEDDLKLYDEFLEARENLYQRNFKTALEKYKSVFEKNPAITGCLVNMGICYLNLSLPEKALELFEQAKRKDNDILTLLNIAKAYKALKNDDQIEQVKSEILTRVKEKPTLMTQRTLVRLISGFIEINELKDAKELFTTFKKFQKMPQVKFLSGVIYAQEKNYKEAIKEFEIVIDDFGVAELYKKKAEQLSQGKIKTFNFEPLTIVDNNETI